VFGSTRRVGSRADDDRNLQLLLAAETPSVTLVARSWDVHVRDVLGTSLEDNLAIMRDSVRLGRNPARRAGPAFGESRERERRAIF
jgi:2-isopropylmalate synthase